MATVTTGMHHTRPTRANAASLPRRFGRAALSSMIGSLAGALAATWLAGEAYWLAGSATGSLAALLFTGSLLRRKP